MSEQGAPQQNRRLLAETVTTCSQCKGRGYLPESQPSPSGDYENISRELIERIATDAVKLAIVRNSLEWDKDADLDEDDIVKDVVGCLTGDDIGCGEEEDADNPELCAAAFVRQRLRSHDAKVRAALQESPSEPAR